MPCLALLCIDAALGLAQCFKDGTDKKRPTTDKLDQSDEIALLTIIQLWESLKKWPRYIVLMGGGGGSPTGQILNLNLGHAF